MNKNFLVRSLSGLIYALLIFLACTSSGSNFVYELTGELVSQSLFFSGLMTLFMVVCAYEIGKMLRYDNPFFIYLTIALCLIPLYIMFVKVTDQAFYFSFNNIKSIITHLLPVLLFSITLVVIHQNGTELVYDTSKMIFTVAHISIPFSLALSFPLMGNFYFGNEVFFLFVLIWTSDTIAYLVGSKFGKTPLAPKISPKKSKEGFYAGIIATIITGVMIEWLTPDMRGNWALIGIFIAFTAPFGDLMASKLKRIFQVKDSGTWIPGHGGFYDRLDSFILSSPVVYLYFNFESLFI